MTQLLLIGDVHMKWQEYRELLQDHEAEYSIQIGDYGWGYPGTEDKMSEHEQQMDKIPGRHYFFRGNHDNPSACRENTRCMGDVYWDPDLSLMSVAGADSIDKNQNVMGVDWWPDEQVDYSVISTAIDLFSERQPRIMLSHDGPGQVVPQLLDHSRTMHADYTKIALQHMFEEHQPDIWVFGHWHTHIDQVVGGTRFVCLEELQSAWLDTDTLELTINV